MQIAPGLQWVRKSLPFALNHINCWLLEGDDGLTIVDAGINSPDSRSEWQQIIASHDKPLKRVVCTHMHPDHVGLAGWLMREYDTEFMMSRSEFLMCRMLVSDTGRDAPQDGLRFYRSAGFAQDELENYGKRFGGFGSMVYQLPDSYIRLQDGETLRLAGDDWKLIATGGHSPEHISLYCAERNVLISGDQLLPGITSNVSVWPTEPDANPMKEWLDGCRYLMSVIPADCLVLPSHGKVFLGAHERLQYIIDMHLHGLEQITEKLQQPAKVTDLFEILFRSRIDEGNRIMAVGEAVANLNYLLAENTISREMQADGTALYQRV